MPAGALDATNNGVQEAAGVAAGLPDKLKTANTNIADVQQRVSAAERLLNEQASLTNKLRWKLRRAKVAGNLHLSTFVSSKLRAQKVQRQQLQKQKRQSATLARQVKALVGKASVHQRQVTRCTRSIAKLQQASLDSAARRDAREAELQTAIDSLMVQLHSQQQQFQQHSVAQAEQFDQHSAVQVERIQQLQHELDASRGIQSDLQTLQSVVGLQQDNHAKELQSLRDQLDAAAGQQAEVERHQIESDAGLRRQVQLAHRATEDLASRFQVSCNGPHFLHYCCCLQSC